MAKQVLTARLIVRTIGQYVSLVQSADHARRGRVVMFWSVVSLLFVCDVLAVVPAVKSFGFLGLVPNLSEKGVLVGLFFITAYYAVRFGFSVTKIFVRAKPSVLWRGFRAYRKAKKRDFEFNTAEEERLVVDLARMHAWSLGGTLSGTHPKYKDHYLIHDNWGMELDQNLDDKGEVQHFSVRLPVFGFLENVVFLMVLPALLCIWALAELVGGFCLIKPLAKFIGGIFP